jgi:hypothetical protein
MNNNLNLKDTINIEQTKNSIKEVLDEIKSNYEKNILIPVNLYDLNEYLTDLENLNNEKNNDITNLITIDYLFFFRIAIINSNSIRIIILQILRKCIKINPLFTNKILDAMIPILICKYFENIKLPFEERYSCLKLCQTWLKLSDKNFPIIFLQSIAAIAKIEEDKFKIGCIEFIRITSISRPDLVNIVGGFGILINSLINENLPKNLVNKIIVSLIYVLNIPNKRKYFNGFGDFYRMFSVFTKSDFSSGMLNNVDANDTKRKEEIKKENENLEKRLNATIPIIIRFLYSWPGYCYIMRDPLAIRSLLIPLNNDVNIIIKKAILKLFREILDICNNIYDNFNIICSENYDYFYINKIYVAFLIKELYSNNLNEHFMKFIEEIDSDELRNISSRILIKFNILFTKILNIDLRSTFSNDKIEKLKWFEESKENIDIPKKKCNGNESYHNENILDSFSNIEKQKAPIQIKIMHLIDIVFHHIECRDTPFLTPQTISSEIIIAINSMLNLDFIKKYENQYSIESAKEELYTKDEEYTQILKNSKILELKEYQQWDWKQIDSLLDIIEIKKELMNELNKQKIFKKILFVYSPSKNLIAKQYWLVDNFFYGAIGKKLFKILSDSQEGIEILDSPNEDTIFLKANSWIKDVMLCLDEILEKNDNEEHPFHIKKINNTLSRNIFIFIGIISNSKLGDDYLNKQGFYTLLNKYINNKNNKYDYLITLLIDNLNFNSKHVSNWIQKIIENGNNEIKRYALNHIRCLLIFGKEVIIDLKVLINVLNTQFQDIDKIIVSIIEIMISKGKIVYPIFKEKSLIEKISQVDSYLLYILMRDEKIYYYLTDIIKKEAEKIDVDKIVEEYAKEMNESLIEVFNLNEEVKNKYYLNINLSEIYDKYNNYYEYFWIKQLPLNIVIQKIENNDKRFEYLLINYLEYHSKENIVKMYSKVQEPQKIIVDKNTGIQIICFLGRISLNKNCNEINNASNFLALSYKDIIKSIIPYKTYKNVFVMKKDNINIILIQNEDRISYTLDKVFFNIQIRPNPIIGLKTPTNLITELVNSEKGNEIIEKYKFFEKLTSYLEIEDPELKDKNSNKIRSSLYMLTKILMKKNAKYFNNKYNIIRKMVKFFNESKDFSMRGTLIYLISFLALNEEIKPEICELKTSYFCNTSICYPIDPKFFDFYDKISYENDKLENDIDIIESEIKLNQISEEIYGYATNLINTLLINMSKNSILRIFNNKRECLKDVNLFIMIYAALSRYRFKEEERKFLMNYFEESIFSNKIALDAMHIIKSLGDNLLNAHNME